MARPGAERPQSHVRERRAARGLRQVELARRVGVTRQALHAIESGRYLPNVALALRLARALACRVEDLFAPPTGAGGATLEGRLLATLPQPPPVRAKVWTVGGHAFVLPVARLGPSADFSVRADAVVVARPQPGARPPRVRVRLLRARGEIERAIAVAGCDPAVQLVGQYVQRQAPPGDLVAWTLGSTAAVEALARGEVHVAGVHVVDPRTGEANLPFLRRHLRKGAYTVVTFASWDAGWLVARGNPRRIRGAADLARGGVRLVNREPGSGARLLLDERLRREGVAPARVRGYGDVATSHLAVGARIAEGRADVGVAVRPIARLLGLDFLPLQAERYDLVVPNRLLQSHPVLGGFLDALLSRDLRADIEALGGYDTRETGRKVEWARGATSFSPDLDVTQK
ncbi:MAG TPA: substrate-binding domain-containing protein [Vicinamibacteria bacterium]